MKVATNIGGKFKFYWRAWTFSKNRLCHSNFLKCFYIFHIRNSIEYLVTIAFVASSLKMFTNHSQSLGNKKPAAKVFTASLSNDQYCNESLVRLRLHIIIIIIIIITKNNNNNNTSWESENEGANPIKLSVACRIETTHCYSFKLLKLFFIWHVTQGWNGLTISIL